MSSNTVVYSDDLFLLDDYKQSYLRQHANNSNTEIIRISCYGNENIVEALKELTIPDLFAPKKVLVLTVAEGKWHQTTQKEVLSLLKNSHKTANLDMLIALSNFKPQQLKNKFFTDLKSSAQFKQLSVPKDMKLNQWIVSQAKKYKMTIEDDAVIYLKEQTQNHLYATDQALLKCQLVGIDHIDKNLLSEILTNNAKYVMQDLIRACVAGENNSIEILNYLRQQKVATVLILWHLTHLLKQSYNAAYQYKIQHISLRDAVAKLWAQDKENVTKLINRVSIEAILALLQKTYAIDKIIKSKGEAETWAQLQALITNISLGIKGV